MKKLMAWLAALLKPAKAETTQPGCIERAVAFTQADEAGKNKMIEDRRKQMGLKP